jgi:hypothetical protein
MTHTKDEALKLALEALEPFSTPNWAGTGVDKANEAITAIKQALAAPVQPVASLKEVDVLMMAETHGIDPSTKGLYGFYIDCISNQPEAQPAPTVQESDCVFVPRDLVGAACAAIEGKRDAPKTLEQLRRYTTGDLSTPPAAPVTRGLMLVPIDPTQEMLDAPPNAYPADALVTWNAMISKVPTPPAAQPAPVQPVQEPLMVDIHPPATQRDRWMYEQGRLAERDPRSHPTPPAQPASVQEPAGEVIAVPMGLSGDDVQIRTHFYQEIPPVGTKVWATPPAAQPAVPLTERDLASACFSYRHDFGLMDETNRGLLMFQAREWARAFGLIVTAAAPEKGQP